MCEPQGQPSSAVVRYSRSVGFKQPELSDRAEIDGKELPPGVGVDVFCRREEDFGYPLMECYKPITHVYDAYYRFQDGNGCWHTTNRRVPYGSTVKFYSYDGEREYVVQV